MMSTYKVPLLNRILRVILLTIIRLLLNAFSRVVVTGLDKVPLGTSYIMVFNHVSLYEAPILLSHWPEKPEVLGAVDVWNRPGQDLLAKAYGGIPIHRGVVDRTAMKRMVQALEAGKALMVAPEGGRSHSPGLRRGKPGIAFLLEKFSIPIIPVALVGATEDFFGNMIRLKRPSVQMTIGDPFLVPREIGTGMGRSEGYQAQVDYVMQKLTSLLPVEYRGYYSQDLSEG
jgi:1-acyl-sn-glycerol-3-phosphate acyltransferase